MSLAIKGLYEARLPVLFGPGISRSIFIAPRRLPTRSWTLAHQWSATRPSSSVCCQLSPPLLVPCLITAIHEKPLSLLGLRRESETLVLFNAFNADDERIGCTDKIRFLHFEKRASRRFFPNTCDSRRFGVPVDHDLPISVVPCPRMTNMSGFQFRCPVGFWHFQRLAPSAFTTDFVHFHRHLLHRPPRPAPTFANSQWPSHTSEEERQRQRERERKDTKAP